MRGELVVDPDARTTVGNACNALDDIRRVGAREVVVVTSRWHAARARAAFRLLLWRHRVARADAPRRPSRSTSTRAVRELLLWLLLPAQVWHAAPARLVELGVYSAHPVLLRYSLRGRGQMSLM